MLTSKICVCKAVFTSALHPAGRTDSRLSSLNSHDLSPASSSQFDEHTVLHTIPGHIRWLPNTWQSSSRSTQSALSQMAQAPLSTQPANMWDYTAVQGWISHHLSSLCAAAGDLPPEACFCHMSLLSDQSRLRHSNKKWLYPAKGPCEIPVDIHPEHTSQIPLYFYVTPSYQYCEPTDTPSCLLLTKRRKQPTSDFPDDGFIPQLRLLLSVFLGFKCWFPGNTSQWNNQKCIWWIEF